MTVSNGTLSSATGWSPMDGAATRRPRCDIDTSADALISTASGQFVNVDASYDNHLAGIAFCGFIGQASMVVGSISSVHAELQALLFAMHPVARLGHEHVIFRTDCKVITERKFTAHHADVAEFHRLLDRHPAWSVVHIGRRSNARANSLARRALRRSALR